MDSFQTARTLQKQNGNNKVNSTIRFANLHIHTIFSDGVKTPSQLLKEVQDQPGLECFALTDHDTLSGIEPMYEEIKKQKISKRFIPGIELSLKSNVAKTSVHIIGLFPNINENNYRDELARIDSVIRDYCNLRGSTRVIGDIDSRIKVAHNELMEQSERSKKYILGVGHDLKTHLTLIKGATDMLKIKVGDDPKFKDMIDLLGIGAKNMIDWVRLMLDFAQADAGKLKPNLKVIDISAEIKEAVDFTKPLAEKKSLEFTVENGHPVYANLDPRLLHHILLNLITNAIKYTKKGSVKIIVKQEKGKATVRVSDTGMGIKNSEIETIFQEYRRGEGTEHIEGMGIGLSIAKKYAELMKGEITAYSQEGKGSVFKLSFPAVIKEEE